MSWFNYIGLIIIVIIMIPNIIFALKIKGGFSGVWHNKAVEILESIGRYACFIFMIFNVPYTYFGFWFSNGLLIYIIINAILVLSYCIIWIFCFRQNGLFRSLTLSIIPSLVFIFSGVAVLSIPLIVFSLIFAPCHILISYKNAE